MTKEEQLITRLSELGASVEISLKYGRFFGRAGGTFWAHAYGPTVDVMLLALVADLEVQQAEAIVKAETAAANDAQAVAQ